MAIALLRFRNVARNCARLFSSSAAVLRQPWTLSADESEGSEEDSDVYGRALKTQRPTTVRFRNILDNNCVSLIGTVINPLKHYNCERIGLYTRFKVKAAPGACRHFFLLLSFWDEMAEMSVQYLKPNDFIYVSGRLESFMGKDESGKSKYVYKVNVREVNFVDPHGLSPASGNLVKQEPKFSLEDAKQRRRDRLHLWQIFFASPHEWWDNRSKKLNPKYPDFKHKDTGEVLWLYDNDPPWVRRQLQLYDARPGKQSPGGPRNARLHLSPLVYDD